MGQRRGQLGVQQWDQVGLSAQGKAPLPGCFRLFLSTSVVVFWFLLSFHQYLFPLQASVAKALSFECVEESWRKLLSGFFSDFLSPWPSFFFSPWFHFCIIQKVHCYSSSSTADPFSFSSVVPEKGTTLFYLHLAACSLQPPAQMWAIINSGLCPLSTTRALLSALRSWLWHIAVPDLLLWAVWDSYFHLPLSPVQANTFSGASRQCPTLLGLTALLCCLEVLLGRSELYSFTWCVMTFHWPLLSCIQPLPSVSRWAWVVISLDWRLPYSFFFCICEVRNTRQLVQGQLLSAMSL